MQLAMLLLVTSFIEQLMPLWVYRMLFLVADGLRVLLRKLLPNPTGYTGLV